MTTLLKNATVYDGTGAPPCRTDIRIEDDRIVQIISAQRKLFCGGTRFAAGKSHDKLFGG